MRIGKQLNPWDAQTYNCLYKKSKQNDETRSGNSLQNSGQHSSCRKDYARYNKKSYKIKPYDRFWSLGRKTLKMICMRHSMTTISFSYSKYFSKNV